MNLQFREFFYESGVYQEGGDYYGHVLGLFHDLFKIYKESFGIDLFTSQEGYFPRFKKTLAAWCNLQFPDGTMPIMGDGAMGANPRGGFQFILKAAGHYDEPDPGFAEHLRWCANRTLRGKGGKALPMDSVNLDPTGLVFRAGFNTPRETMLFLRVGPTWSHWHQDQGQIQCQVLGGKASPVRSTCSGAHSWAAAGGPHQTISVGGQALMGGNVERFAPTGVADLGIGRIHGRGADPDVVRRHVLFLRNDYFLLYDHVKSSEPSHFQTEGSDPKYFRFIDGGGPDRKAGQSYRSIIDWAGRETELLGGGRCVRVTKEAERDYCFLMDATAKSAVEGIEFEGRYGVVRLRPGRVEFALFEASRVVASGVEVLVDPKSKTLTGKLRLDGKISVGIALGDEAVPTSLEIDGERAEFSPIRNGARLELGKSDREFTLRFLPKTWESGVRPSLWAVARTAVTANRARITWTTDQPGDSVVEYGTTPELGQRARSAQRLTRIHEVQLEQLPAGQQIFFRVVTRGIEGKSASLNGDPFVTRAPAKRGLPPEEFTIRFGAQGSSVERERELACQVTRLEIAWDHLYSEKGKFDLDRLEGIAGRIREYRRAGIEPVVLLTYCHDWAQKHTDRQAEWFHPFFGPPDHAADWKDFVRPIMERLKGHVRWYEIWNEPDGHYLADNTEPGQPTIFGKPAGRADTDFHDNTRYWLQDRYVPLVMAAREVADEVDPSIRLMAPSWNHDYHGGRGRLCFQVGLHHYIDAYGVHAYIGPPQNFARWHHWIFDTCFRHADDAMEDVGVSFPMMITEWGFPGAGKPDASLTDHQTERDQAALIAKAMLLQAASGRVRFSILYRLEGSEFGLARNQPGEPLGPRPAYGVFKTLAGLLGNKVLRPSDRVRIEPAGGLRWIALDLAGEKETVIALWPTGWVEKDMRFEARPARTVTLSCRAAPSAKVRSLPLFGKPRRSIRVAQHEDQTRWETRIPALPSDHEVLPQGFVVSD